MVIICNLWKSITEIWVLSYADFKYLRNYECWEVRISLPCTIHKSTEPSMCSWLQRRTGDLCFVLRKKKTWVKTHKFYTSVGEILKSRGNWQEIDTMTVNNLIYSYDKHLRRAKYLKTSTDIFKPKISKKADRKN